MNKRLIAAFLALGLTAQSPPNLGAPASSDRTVLISHGRIAAYGAASSVTVPSGAKANDGRGYTLTPKEVGIPLTFTASTVTACSGPIALLSLAIHRTSTSMTADARRYATPRHRQYRTTATPSSS